MTYEMKKPNARLQYRETVQKEKKTEEERSDGRERFYVFYES